MLSPLPFPPPEAALARTPPHNFEAEQALLGAILSNNRALERVAEFLRAEHFADPVHGRIYEACQTLAARNQIANPVTLKTYMGSDAGLGELGGDSYLARLAAAAVTIINAEDYGRLVFDLFLRRELIVVGEDMVNEAFEPDLENPAVGQIEIAEKKLFELATAGQAEGGFRPFKASVLSAIELAEAAHKRDGKLSGVTTGLRDMDKKLGGLHASDLLILAGRPSMGKTALATNIAFNAAKAYRTEISPTGEKKVVDGAVVAFFSLEMSADQLATRILAERCEINSHAIRQGELTHQEFERLVVAAQELNDLPLYIDDTPALSVSAVRTRARRSGPHPRPGDDRHRLSAAAAGHHRQALGKPRAGNFRHHPQSEGPGQGTERAGPGPVPVVPRRRTARRQTAAAVGLARIGLDRAGRRRGDVRLSANNITWNAPNPVAARKRPKTNSTSATKTGRNACPK